MGDKNGSSEGDDSSDSATPSGDVKKLAKQVELFLPSVEGQGIDKLVDKVEAV